MAEGRTNEVLVPAGRVIEAASWHIVAEMVRRYPGKFTLIEAHPAGGMADCLSLFDRGVSEPPPRIELNRRGSAHVRAPDGSATSWDLWTSATTVEDPRDLVRRLSDMTGLPPVAKLPASTAMVVSYRFIAAFLSHTVFQREHWHCLNGYEDTSGYGGGVRHEFFRAFPLAKARAGVREPSDMLGIPEYRFWFLVRGSSPRLAIEATRGVAWSEDGAEHDLMARYRLSRRIWPVVWEVGGRFLP